MSTSEWRRKVRRILAAYTRGLITQDEAENALFLLAGRRLDLVGAGAER